MSKFTFPKWSNKATLAVLGVAHIVPVYALFLLYYGGNPKTTDIGYAPKQPVPYSHALHVGQLGMDCRYCHTGVETTAKALIPPTQTCINCHTNVRANSDKLQAAFISRDTGYPVEWIRVHDLPDYVYFNHSAHVSRGVSCVSCHGRIDQMEVVAQDQTLSMGWCLDCHRNPEKHLRPVDKVTQLDWMPEDQIALGKQLIEEYKISPSTDCSTCHR